MEIYVTSTYTSFEEDSIRMLNYDNTKYFVLVLPLENPDDSFIISEIPRVKTRSPSATFVLLGTFKNTKPPNSMTQAKGEEIAKKLKAQAFFTCNVMDYKEVRQTVAKIATLFLTGSNKVCLLVLNFNSCKNS